MEEEDEGRQGGGGGEEGTESGDGGVEGKGSDGISERVKAERTGRSMLWWIPRERVRKEEEDAATRAWLRAAEVVRGSKMSVRSWNEGWRVGGAMRANIVLTMRAFRSVGERSARR